MLLPRERVQIILVFSGIALLVLGGLRYFTDANYVRPGIMRRMGDFIAVLPKEAGPWLLVSGLVVLGSLYFIRER